MLIDYNSFYMRSNAISKNTVLNDWLSLIKANDENALKQLYNHNFKQVRIYILNNSGTEADVKDIFQEAFVAFWRNVHLDKFLEQDSNAIDRYLMSIAKYKWIDHLRKQKKMQITELDNNEAFLEEIPSVFSLEEEEHYNKIKAHFSKMDPTCQLLLHKFYFKKEKLKQIAAYFSWKEATTKNNKYRCIQKLRKAVLDNK